MAAKHELRFRQVHLDFHTSPLIPGIGKAFDKKLWQERLQTGHVDSITCFSCCHHGWSYHPSKVGAMHPHLDFNLLRAQIDACHEINVKVPIYLTAGINNRVAELEPGWREVNPQGQWNGWARSPLEPGFKSLCFNSPYMDYLARLIAEAAEMFPDADGMFFDIISQGQCCCPWCMRDMEKEGYDPTKEEDRLRFSRRTLRKYFRVATEAARSVHADFPVFHNFAWLSTPGNEDVYQYFSHVELESLPTGGAGYDSFPMSASFCRKLPDYEFAGMTGKFHRGWGEFGSFKAPEALRYECCAMIAQGAKCSIGDQLHPDGMLDESTYRMIGEAYQEVEQKEAWCRNSRSAANVAVLSNRWFLRDPETDKRSEMGVSRILLEGHIPFDSLRDIDDFGNYKVLILADNIRPDASLRKKLEDFLKKGGKLILSCTSLLKKEDDTAAFPIGTAHGIAEEFPTYIQAAEGFIPKKVTTPFVIGRPSLKFKASCGKSLGQIFEPYFKRAYNHFSSHRQTPFKPEPSGYDAGVLTENILYFAHPVFLEYALWGNVVVKDYILKGIRALTDGIVPVRTNLPSAGRLFLMEQPEEKRYIAHALYANIINRGMNYDSPEYWSRPVEIIDELLPVYNIDFEFSLPEKIGKVTLEPEGKEIPFEISGNKVKIHLDEFICHQMIVLHY